MQQRQDAVEIARREQEDREGDRRDEEEGVEDAAPEGVGSRAPKKIEKMTPLPMQSPSTTEVRKTISV